MAEKVLRDRGYRSDTIATSRDMGPLREGGFCCHDFMKVCIERVQVTQAQGQGASF